MTGLPEGWIWATVGELGEYINGRGFKKAEWSTSGRPIIRIQNLTGSGSSFNYFDGTLEERYVVPPGSLLVSWAATLGVYGWNGPEGALNQHIFRVCSFIDEGFHRYLLQHALDLMQGNSHGSGMVHITRGRFDATPVPLPPLAEQKRIVTAIEEAFSKLDAGEAGLRTARQLLKRMRDAILTAAVTGRLVPQDPTDTPAAKLLADLGTEPADTAGLAYIPDGWAGVALGDLAEVISGPAFKSTQFKEAGEGTRLLRGENIEPGQLRWRDIRTWPDALLPGYEHLHVEVSDLILAMDRPVISTGLKLAPVRPADLPALLVQRVARIRPKTDCLRSFLLITMQHSRFVSHLLGGQVGTQLPHITLKGIREFTLACPGPEEMARIVAEVERQFSFVEACERAVDAGLARSAALRQSVLKAAFEGRLVPQDPLDEPASVLLDRIRTERSAQPVAKRRARQTA